VRVLGDGDPTGMKAGAEAGAATGVEEVENMTGMEVMTGIKGMKNAVRKERRASLHQRGSN